jgi:hypothetical protein
MFQALVDLRYMFAGLIAGSVLGLIYKRLAHGSFRSDVGIGSTSAMTLWCLSSWSARLLAWLSTYAEA